MQPSSRLDQIAQLGLAFEPAQLVHDLVGHRDERGRLVGQRRLGHEDQRFAAGEPLQHLGGGLAARELAEELFDVLDFEGAGLERILLDQVFHGGVVAPSIIACAGGRAGRSAAAARARTSRAPARRRAVPRRARGCPPVHAGRRARPAAGGSAPARGSPASGSASASAASGTSHLGQHDGAVQRRHRRRPAGDQRVVAARGCAASRCRPTSAPRRGPRRSPLRGGTRLSTARRRRDRARACPRPAARRPSASGPARRAAAARRLRSRPGKRAACSSISARRAWVSGRAVSGWRDEQRHQPHRLFGDVLLQRLRPGGRPVPFAEHQVEGVEHRRQPLGDVGGGRQRERQVVRPQGPLRPHQALGHRRFLHQEGAGDLADAEAADHLQREGDPRRRGPAPDGRS